MRHKFGVKLKFFIWHTGVLRDSLFHAFNRVKLRPQRPFCKQTETKGKDQNRLTHKYTYTIALLWNSLLAGHQGCFKYSRASERKGRHRLSSSPVVTLFCAAGSLFLNFMDLSLAFSHIQRNNTTVLRSTGRPLKTEPWKNCIFSFVFLH